MAGGPCPCTDRLLTRGSLGADAPRTPGSAHGRVVQRTRQSGRKQRPPSLNGVWKQQAHPDVKQPHLRACAGRTARPKEEGASPGLWETRGAAPVPSTPAPCCVSRADLSLSTLGGSLGVTHPAHARSLPHSAPALSASFPNDRDAVLTGTGRGAAQGGRHNPGDASQQRARLPSVRCSVA